MRDVVCLGEGVCSDIRFLGGVSGSGQAEAEKRETFIKVHVENAESKRSERSEETWKTRKKNAVNVQAETLAPIAT